MQNALLEHSAILSTCTKLQFIVKTFVLSIFEWPFQGGVSFVDKFCYLCFVFILFSCLFVAALRSPTGKKADLWALLCVIVYFVFVTFPCGVLGKVWCLIVSIPDFFLLLNRFYCIIIAFLYCVCICMYSIVSFPRCHDLVCDFLVTYWLVFYMILK